jgi:hypothetical protein
LIAAKGSLIKVAISDLQSSSLNYNGLLSGDLGSIGTQNIQVQFGAGSGMLGVN